MMREYRKMFIANDFVAYEIMWYAVFNDQVPKYLIPRYALIAMLGL
jgi:hypothetical protein